MIDSQNTVRECAQTNVEAGRIAVDVPTTALYSHQLYNGLVEELMRAAVLEFTKGNAIAGGQHVATVQRIIETKRLLDSLEPF